MTKDEENAVRAALRRRLQKPDEFTAARQLRLPEDKNSFPKLIVLDINHWIRLARVHHGRTQDAAAASALTALRAAQQAGRIVVPINDINLGEAMGSADLSRRHRLAEFMVGLAGNYSLAGHLKIEPAEIANALTSAFLQRAVTVPIRRSLVQWGVAHSLSPRRITVGDEAIDALINDVLDYPELSVSGIVHAQSPEQARQRNQQEAEGMKRVAAVRELDQHMDPVARHALELSNLDTGRIDRLLMPMAIDATSFHAWLRVPENRLRFWHAVPGADVFVTMFIERDKNTHAKSHRNDGRDLSMLKVAIPYANIVLAENLWAHLANSTGLAAKYATTVIADLARLPDALRDQGCLPA